MHRSHTSLFGSHTTMFKIIIFLVFIREFSLHHTSSVPGYVSRFAQTRDFLKSDQFVQNKIWKPREIRDCACKQILLMHISLSIIREKYVQMNSNAVTKRNFKTIFISYAMYRVK